MSDNIDLSCIPPLHIPCPYHSPQSPQVIRKAFYTWEASVPLPTTIVDTRRCIHLDWDQLALGGLWVLLNQSPDPKFGMNGFFKNYFILILFIFLLCTVFIPEKAFLSCAKRGLLSSGFSSQWLLFLWSTGSRVQGLSCSVACGIFPD